MSHGKRGTCRASDAPHTYSERYCDDFRESEAHVDGMVDSLRKALLDAETRAEQNRALAQRYRDRLDAVEQERDAMALALARKEIAK